MVERAPIISRYSQQSTLQLSFLTIILYIDSSDTIPTMNLLCFFALMSAVVYCCVPPFNDFRNLENATRLDEAIAQYKSQEQENSQSGWTHLVGDNSPLARWPTTSEHTALLYQQGRERRYRSYSIPRMAEMILQDWRIESLYWSPARRHAGEA